MTHTMIPSWRRGGDPDWHLHAPMIGTVTQEFLTEVSHSAALTDTERHAFDYLYDSSLYPEQTSPVTRFPHSSLLVDDFATMTQRDITEIIEKGVDSNYFAYVFTVAEAHKRRRRVVIDALAANMLCERPPHTHFTPIAELVTRVKSFRFAVAFDIKCMFFQFPLSPAVRKFFPFQDDRKRTHVFKRLPMGFTWAVQIAQSSMKHLARDLGVTVEIYIDNVLLLSNDQRALERAADIFRQRCRTANLLIGDDSGVTQQFAYRGIAFDLMSRTHRLDTKFVEKFLSRVDTANSTWADMRALIGSLVYGCMVLNIPLAHIFHVLKFLAKHTATPPRSSVTMWKQAQAEFLAVSQAITLNATVSAPSIHHQAVLVTDAATTTGLGGAVLISPSGKLHTATIACSGYHTINDLEAQALSRALGHFAPMLHHTRIKTYVDNTATIGALAATHSKSFHLNRWVGSIIAKVSQIHAHIELEYVNTHFNVADPISRGVHLSQEHLRWLATVPVAGGWCRWSGSRLTHEYVRLGRSHSC